MESPLFFLIPIYIFHIIFIVGGVLFRRRLRAVRERKVSLGHFRAYEDEPPYDLRVAQNHFANQFEVPVLFFFTCLAAVMKGIDTPVAFWLGCLFIASRLAHTFIHLGSNDVRWRAISFFVGVFAIVGMWVAMLVALVD